MKTSIYILLIIAQLSVAGCGTAVARFSVPEMRPKTAFYRATTFNSSVIYCTFSNDCPAVWIKGSIPVALFNIVDFPISVASDTLLLPYDVFKAINSTEKPPAKEPGKSSGSEGNIP